MQSQAYEIPASTPAGLLSQQTPAAAARDTMYYTVVAQSSIDVQNVDNAPAISMAKFLTDRNQLSVIPTISIYSRRGHDSDHTRFLYMNGPALEIWRTMGMHPNTIGMQHRPPQSATLAFGVPFSA